MTAVLSSTENSKMKSDNTQSHKNFDYTTIADRLRTVSYINDSHINLSSGKCVL